MPLYEYECVDHGSFTHIRPMAQAKETGTCPVCQGASERTISTPTLMTMTPLARDAAQRNEQSRCAPRITKGGCAGHRQGPSPQARSGRGAVQTYTGPRPWVIEHR